MLSFFSQYKEDAIRQELSNPARFRIQGGTLSVTNEGRTKEILVSNIGLFYVTPPLNFELACGR